jgi:hypothetical protein
MGIVVALLLALPTVAYAGARTTFSAITELVVVGPLQAINPGTDTPMDTEADFKTRRRSGEIILVTVETTNEFVTSAPSGIQLTSCQPADSPFCAAIQGASLSSLHDSKARLRNVSQVPGAALSGLDPAFAVFPDVLVGDLRGNLEGTVTVAGDNPEDVMQGEIALRIRRNPDSPDALPTAVYGCIASLIPFNPTPQPIAQCQEGEGELVPLFLNIRDTGRVKLDEAFGVFSEVDKARAKLEVTIVGVNGVGVITKGRAKLDD